MGTNPLGKGTQNLSVNVPSEMKEALQELADKSGVKLSQYLRAILMKAVDRGTSFEFRENKRRDP